MDHFAIIIMCFCGRGAVFNPEGFLRRAFLHQNTCSDAP